MKWPMTADRQMFVFMLHVFDIPKTLYTFEKVA